jgi:hypothetical protein
LPFDDEVGRTEGEEVVAEAQTLLFVHLMKLQRWKDGKVISER